MLETDRGKVEAYGAESLSWTKTVSNENGFEIERIPGK